MENDRTKTEHLPSDEIVRRVPKMSRGLDATRHAVSRGEGKVIQDEAKKHAGARKHAPLRHHLPPTAEMRDHEPFLHASPLDREPHQEEEGSNPTPHSPSGPDMAVRIFSWRKTESSRHTGAPWQNAHSVDFTPRRCRLCHSLEAVEMCGCEKAHRSVPCECATPV